MPSFNPLPTPKYREIVRVTESGSYISVSIRSLHRSIGRYTPPPPGKVDLRRFNPLPTPKYREIVSALTRLRAYLEFQSAPYTEV